MLGHVERRHPRVLVAVEAARWEWPAVTRPLLPVDSTTAKAALTDPRPPPPTGNRQRCQRPPDTASHRHIDSCPPLYHVIRP
ncbi:hypothetical protein E2C01_073897 [Portunus trituberculatus]|uniref:Uncharacterized protein n=1 Tax=Portunus trituberculatus TaxID=210409 RepID=A0A5B7I6K3_PORTR|nr:hypothetical protein [Portunus trituberculatus]